MNVFALVSKSINSFEQLLNQRIESPEYLQINLQVQLLSLN